MRLKLDLFSWIVIGVVLLLVVFAIVTVSASGRSQPPEAEYLTEDAPSTPVFNAIVAVQRGDAAHARAQFTATALAEIEKNGYDPIANAVTYSSNDPGARRVRIVEVKQEQEDEAFVTVAEDNYSSGGLFDRSTYTNERVVRVVREDGKWKVADTNLFY
jgi:hypothetical protein